MRFSNVNNAFMSDRSFYGFPESGISFLRSLKRNNKRDWFQKRKAQYLEDLKTPMESLILELANDFRQFAPEMVANPKVSSFRIYRDTRFSKDKTPYKTHIAAVFPRKNIGKHEGAGFYVHISPDEVFVGGGLHKPSRENLFAVRRYLSENYREFLSEIESYRFKELFGGIYGDKLIRVPRGFRPDNPASDLLKHKQFLVSRPLPSYLATTPEFYGYIVETFKVLLPVVRFLNSPILKNRISSSSRVDFV